MLTANSIRATVEGRAIPLPGDDVDTDRIIPARFMREITFTSLGNYAFYDERHDEAGRLKPHPLNDPRFTGNTILIVGSNFGCGSSREHAPQALMRCGITGFVGVSFSEIFSGNCTALGLPALRVSVEIANALTARIQADPATPVVLDLVKSEVRAGADHYPAHMPESDRRSLVTGMWDTLSVLLANDAGISATAGRLPYINGFGG